MPNTVYRPEDYGALGNGSANDTPAFRSMSAAVQAAGGGTIELRNGATYMVGEQTLTGQQGQGWAYRPEPIITLDGLTEAIHIIGNGATLKCRPGLRYGAFDPVTGQPYSAPLPFNDPSYAATPYGGMIALLNCLGSIRIEDVELDGNAAALVLGGQYGDTGYQLPACGLFLIDNAAELIVSNVFVHDQAQDGVQVRSQARENQVRRPQLYTNVRSDRNARQGWSIIGGRGITLIGCTGTRTGRGAFSSAPGAGVDLEAENGNVIREVVLLNCEFSDNIGAALVADTGDTADIVVKRSKLVGTTSNAIYCTKPRFVVEDSTIVGASVLGFASSARTLDSHRYVRCLFTDDTALSPTGQVFAGPAMDMGVGSFFTSFIDCQFRLIGQGLAPFSNGDAHFHNVRMEQSASSPSSPRGTYSGDNYLSGAIFTDATVPRHGGKLFYAGLNSFWRDRQAPIGAFSVPANGRIEVAVGDLYGVRVGDIVHVASSVDLGALDLRCQVTGVNAAKLIYTNYTNAAINKPAETVSIKAADRLG